ncbi:FMN-dependent NADH-azoreductase [Actinospica sp.]|uniref:FMN-dependent NADH-azoreductase n=1 Tax=Actinospica sp. TaxID=1872142 RepID=UPI002B5B9A22|nr:NAD(P)H-dependent oxidoreductase [Actinospica sp.]HWG25336.1 NAD(P)H-dependent oxidoreductase [Actinospica sp.]
MARLLHIDSSLFSQTSVSKDVARTFRETWAAEHPGGTVTYRDLGARPIPPLDELTAGAGYTPAERRTPEQQAAFAQREQLVNEVLEADAYLFGVPMYNWAVPGTFKDWLDQILVNGKVFGLEPLPLAGRPATVVASYGGGYFPGTPRDGWDHVQPYLETVLGKALGLDVRFITVQLTGAERVPAMADLVPQAKELRAKGHADAAAHAKALATRFETAGV